MASENSVSPKLIDSLINLIKEKGSSLKEKTVTAGFDGFVDTIIKVIRNKHANTQTDYFRTIEEFGNYVLEKKGASFSLESEERSIKIGGNMPIIANAVGSLGVRVNCIGAFGYPQKNKIFDGLSGNCKIFSFAEPGTSAAFEFNDGKMMVGNMGALNTTGWEHVKNSIGREALVDLYRKSDLLCLVNWSEIDASGDIWKGLLADVIPEYAATSSHQLSFFDLSDCSKRSDDAILDVLNVLTAFAKHTKVTLGLNKNEATRFHQVLYGSSHGEFVRLGENIFKKLAVETLLLHSSREAFAIGRNGVTRSTSFFIENPKLSTGAGDNFNAGYNAARLLDLELPHCLIFAHAVSGYYVTHGKSPSLPEIVNFLEGQKRK